MGMESFSQNLAAWTATASRNTEDARRDLSLQLSDYVLQNDVMATEEAAVIDELLPQVLAYAEKAVRGALADKLVDLPGAPKSVIKHLACDEIDIAGPLLLRSPAFTDDDLIEVVDAAETPHRAAVAARPDIGGPVCERLADTGEAPVLVNLAKNRKAKLTRKATETLVAHSKEVEALRKPLLARRDLPPDFAHRMFWWASSALRVHILQNFPVDPEMLDAALKAATREAIADDAARGGVALDAARVMAKRVSVNDFIAALDQGDTRASLSAICALLDVSLTLAKRILMDESGEALAVACRAMDADRAQFTRLYLLLDYKRYGKPRPMGHMERAGKAFDALTRDKALQTVQFWNTQTDQLQAA